ncbi:MAG: ATP-binding cassette domain-containing protein [Thiothrix sp.]|nr:ATP-binding cassette domain-containing protein [Thiothrix sp.]HPE62036.1 ATP-binding cassette domain-containing protein [Thiolinea sp.]
MDRRTDSPSGVQVTIDRKVYANGLCTLKGLHFAAAPGEFVALVGPSGSGKTTVLNIVAGLDTRFEGQVQRATAARLGFMFQEPRLLPWLTVEQNIELVLNPLPPTQRQERRAHLQALLAQVGLQDFRTAYPGALSGGMQRRLALVRAFVIQPELLLMDEPFLSLDEPTAEQLRQQLLALWQQTGSTILFVTHHLREALMLADRVLFLSARPAHLILEQPVTAARPRTMVQMGALEQLLLHQYPELLSGVLA